MTDDDWIHGGLGGPGMKQRSPPSGSEEAERQVGRRESIGEADGSPVERQRIDGADDDLAGQTLFLLFFFGR